ncbi:hypothetical protein GO986_05175 [Deinococcus sp. HMF7620]|uniref:Uncharacterized protein n=1 Tax=Deinococcus arboris TaxID=2682977 RepID=A0A7C9I208_9DEIO|nr:hypothetical protein [Deinococcus arboris]MVN86151.1 hypothetical protein [Deinococcus arboris]
MKSALATRSVRPTTSFLSVIALWLGSWAVAQGTAAPADLPHDPALVVPGIWGPSLRVVPGSRAASLLTAWGNRFAFLAPLESRLGEDYLLLPCEASGRTEMRLSWSALTPLNAGTLTLVANLGDGSPRNVSLTRTRADWPDLFTLTQPDAAALLAALQAGQNMTLKLAAPDQAGLTFWGAGFAAAWAELSGCRL